MLVTTRCGWILHGCYMSIPDEGILQTIDKFDRVLFLGDGMPILDIKIASFKTKVKNAEGLPIP